MLVAVVLAAAPLASGLGASVSPDCVAPATAVEECCGDTSSGGTCAATCAIGDGSTCMAPAALGAGTPGAAARIGSDAPAAPLRSLLVSPAAAPDTAPPKTSCA